MNTKIETFIRHQNHSFKLISTKEGSSFKSFRIDGKFEVHKNQISFNPSKDPLLIAEKKRLRSLENFHLRLLRDINKSYKLSFG